MINSLENRFRFASDLSEFSGPRS